MISRTAHSSVPAPAIGKSSFDFAERPVSRAISSLMPFWLRSRSKVGANGFQQIAITIDSQACACAIPWNNVPRP